MELQDREVGCHCCFHFSIMFPSRYISGPGDQFRTYLVTVKPLGTNMVFTAHWDPEWIRSFRKIMQVFSVEFNSFLKQFSQANRKFTHSIILNNKPFDDKLWSDMIDRCLLPPLNLLNHSQSYICHTFIPLPPGTWLRSAFPASGQLKMSASRCDTPQTSQKCHVTMIQFLLQPVTCRLRDNSVKSITGFPGEVPVREGTGEQRHHQAGRHRECLPRLRLQRPGRDQGEPNPHCHRGSKT